MITDLDLGETTETPWRATGLEAPVFADPTGRRARAMGAIGLTLAAATLAALVILVTAGIGFYSLPLALPVARTVATKSASTVKRTPHRALDADARPGASRGQRAAELKAEDLVDGRPATGDVTGGRPVVPRVRLGQPIPNRIPGVRTAAYPNPATSDD